MEQGLREEKEEGLRKKSQKWMDESFPDDDANDDEAEYTQWRGSPKGNDALAMKGGCMMQVTKCSDKALAASLTKTVEH